MPCESPITLKTKRHVFIDGHLVYMHNVVPCGQCLECLKRKRSEWSVRITEEERISSFSSFVTLTYDEDHLPETQSGNMTLKKQHLENFCKRVRLDENKLRYFGCGEYGTENGRPHYHIIMFNVDPEIIYKKWSVYGEEFGHVHIGKVNPPSIHYITKYIINPEKYMEDPEQVLPFQNMSKGLGKNYLLRDGKVNFNSESNTYIFDNGKQAVLPRYYSNRIFSGQIFKAQDPEDPQKMIDLFMKAKKAKNAMIENIEFKELTPEQKAIMHQYNYLLFKKQSKSA